eukprot:scaffold1072_cov125-Skeletonema_dohrnii-CCMP3373.AAC.8
MGRGCRIGLGGIASWLRVAECECLPSLLLGFLIDSLPRKEMAGGKYGLEKRRKAGSGQRAANNPPCNPQNAP